MSVAKPVTINPCAMCRPLGAVLAVKGVAGAVPLLHGSQGCATYMRRHLTGHFQEPVDIASSSLTENQAVYGGSSNLKTALTNVRKNYRPEVIAVLTTCLAETIGDDVVRILKEYHGPGPMGRRGALTEAGPCPPLVFIATPSYRGSHVEGYHDAVWAFIKTFAEEGNAAAAATGAGKGGDGTPRVNVFPGLISPADSRYLHDVLRKFRLRYMMLPDIAYTLDGIAGAGGQGLMPGGTPLEDIRGAGRAQMSLQLGRNVDPAASAARYLAEGLGVPARILPLPIGVAGTDALMEALTEASGRPQPWRYREERGRLLDAMVDTHKLFFGRRPVIYGEADLVEGLTSYALELGMEPAVVAATDGSTEFQKRLEGMAWRSHPGKILWRCDFADIEQAMADSGADLLLGNSNGAYLAAKWHLPLVRVGLPIHDRPGGQRRLVVGYAGALELLDRLADAYLSTVPAGHHTWAGGL